MKTIIKERLLFVFKYLTGLVLLLWILSRVDRREMILAITRISWPVLLALLGMVFLNIGMQFARWKYLVESNSRHFRTQDLIPSFFAGFAFRLMIPGGHAEITKIFLLPGKKNGKVFAFGIEKFFQTFIKLILVLITLPLIFPELRLYLWSSAGIVVFSYFFLPRLLKNDFFKRFQEREVHYPRIFFRTLIFSLSVFFCLTVEYYLLLNEIKTIDLISTALVVIFIWSSGLIPISISGLGVRENLAVFFLVQYDVPGYAAVGISLFLFFLNGIIPALIGVYFILTRRHHLKDAGGAIKSVTQRFYNKKNISQSQKLPETNSSETVLTQNEPDSTSY